MNDTRYSELLVKQANKSITFLQTEELSLLRQLSDNIGKQAIEQHEREKKRLEELALGENSPAAIKRRKQAIAEEKKAMKEWAKAQIIASKESSKKAIADANAQTAREVQAQEAEAAAKRK